MKNLAFFFVLIGITAMIFGYEATQGNPRALFVVNCIMEGDCNG